MTSKEYLEQIGKLEHKIKCMKLRSEEYDRLSMSLPTQDFTRDRVQTTPNLDAPFVKWIMKKAELDKQIENNEKKLKELRAEAVLKIEELDNENYKNVLVLRYLKYMNWDDICCYLFAAKRTVMRWHENALEGLKV